MKDQIPFQDYFALADCAARAFAAQRTSENPDLEDAKCRQFLRAEPVRALRYLWKSGDVDQRSTVAARVGVWMRRPQVGETIKRILERERVRLA